jgi:hypothetical protein
MGELPAFDRDRSPRLDAGRGRDLIDSGERTSLAGAGGIDRDPQALRKLKSAERAREMASQLARLDNEGRDQAPAVRER